MHPKINDKDEIVWWNQGHGNIIFYHNSIFTELTNSLRSAWGPQEPQLNDHGFVVFQGWHGSVTDIYLASRVSVISPDGGEPIPSGLPYTIRWTGPSRAVKYKVKYSIDNGLTWNKAHQEPYVTGTTLNWDVPAPPGNKRKCLVEAIGFDASGKAISRDQSDAPFTIEVLKLTSPNGGETPTQGDPLNIEWTSHETQGQVAKVKLSYTVNGGRTWLQIVTLKDATYWVPGSHSYGWQAPEVPITKTNCKVQLELIDGAGNVLGRDQSDNPFQIEPIL